MSSRIMNVEWSDLGSDGLHVPELDEFNEPTTGAVED